ncbi:hypothetical protein PsorP6_016810 [Peronosclerospora sorghi]|uniref:Uncharacterized protein n=1 Tax=Peronosclerospora sorghi TaxID=230839 RepID=A0ACC0WFZ9_9STRA|nr:hypothetical protein PsorP6_016810 [Peronosclerospora sorghi]
MTQDTSLAVIENDNAKTLLARGAHALHDHTASLVEKALGRPLPQMQVRFKDVSITAEIIVKDETNAKTELPTLVNVLKTSAQELRSNKHVVKKEILQNIPYVFVSTFLFVAPFYFMVGFTGFKTFLAYWVHLSLHVLWQAYFGQFMSYFMPTVNVAQVFGILLETIFFLFSGFNPPGKSIPQGYTWLYDISAQKYPLALLSALVFGECPSDGHGSQIGCKVMTGLPPTLPSNLTVKAYLADNFLIKSSDIYKNFGILFAFIAVTLCLSLLSLRYLNHQKR